MATKMEEQNSLPLGPSVFLPAIPKMYNFTKYAPMPDTCNNGPVVVLRSDVEEPLLVTRKFSCPPPWSATKPCSAPCCSAHIRVDYLSCVDPTLSLQQRRRCEVGNLLQSLPSADEKLQLFHAVNTVDGSIVCLYDIPSSLEAREDLLDKQMFFRKFYHINDLQCVRIQNETFMLTRGKHQVDLHRLCGDSLEYRNAEWKSDVILTGACLSQTYSDKWMETNEHQEVSLKNCERTEQTIWSQRLPDCKETGREREWCSALFAYEDSVALATNRTNVYLCDFRKNKPDCLLDVLNPKFGGKVDEIFHMNKSQESPYMFLVTSQHILLLDERRCDQPAITWNHLLLDQPTRSVLQPLQGLDIFMLSNNLEKRVAFASVQNLNILNETTERYLMSPSLIFHHDFVNPMKTFAHKKGLLFDYRVSERLSKFQNSGLATAKSSQGRDFTVFLSTTAGDIFSQKFNFKSSGCESESSSESLAVVKRLKAYEKSAKNLFSKPREDYHTLDVSPALQQRLREGNVPPMTSPLWDVRQTVDKVKGSSSYAKTLAGTRVFKWSDFLVQEYKEGPNVTPNASTDEAVDPISKYFHSKTVEITSHEWLNSRGDELALRILNFWPLTGPQENELPVHRDDEEKNPFYRTVPYDKKFGRSESVKKCRPRSPNGSTTDGASSGLSTGSRSLSGYSGSRATQGSSVSASSRSVTGVGERSTPHSQELLEAYAAAAVVSVTPATPLPSAASQASTPLFSRTPASITSTIKKKRKRNAGF